MTQSTNQEFTDSGLCWSVNPEDHLGLIYKMAHKIAPDFMADPDELVAEGYFALCRASAGFDPSRGLRFSTYACRAIHNAMMDQLTGSKNRRSTARRKPLLMDPWLIGRTQHGDSDPVAETCRRELVELARDYVDSLERDSHREMALLMACGNDGKQIDNLTGGGHSSSYMRRRTARKQASKRLLSALNELSIAKSERRPYRKTRRLRAVP